MAVIRVIRSRGPGFLDLWVSVPACDRARQPAGLGLARLPRSVKACWPTDPYDRTDTFHGDSELRNVLPVVIDKQACTLPSHTQLQG
jgi:hypothetical protein